MIDARIRQAEEALQELLGMELSQIIDAVSKPPSADSPYMIELPDAYTVDKDIEEILSLVARTSNAYNRVARFAGMARAEAKLAKGRFERKYKKSKRGKNAQEREAAAMEDCSDEHIAMATTEAVAELADAMESAARVASESIRKILDKAQAMQIASHREMKGSYSDKDFAAW